MADTWRKRSPRRKPEYIIRRASWVFVEMGLHLYLIINNNVVVVICCWCRCLLMFCCLKHSGVRNCRLSTPERYLRTLECQVPGGRLQRPSSTWVVALSSTSSYTRSPQWKLCNGELCSPQSSLRSFHCVPGRVPSWRVLHSAWPDARKPSAASWLHTRSLSFTSSGLCDLELSRWVSRVICLSWGIGVLTPAVVLLV